MKKLSLSRASILSFSFLVSLVSAETVLDTIKSWFANSSLDLSFLQNLQDTVTAQVLMFILVALIIYSIAEFIPFLERKDWVAVLISVIVAALATLYLKSEEIYTILLSYSALGIALTLIVPFILIFVLAKKLHEKGYGLAGRLLWAIFLVAILMKYLTADLDEIGNFGTLFFILIALISLIMLLFQSKIFFRLFKAKLKGIRESSKAEALSEITAELVLLRDRINAAPDDSAAAPLIQKFNRLVKRQNDLGGNWKTWGS